VTLLKIIYARKPVLLAVLFLINRLVEKNVSLSPSFRILFQAHVSMLNGCSFCHDVREALAVQQSIGLERFRALQDYRASVLFTDREQAALAFAEEFSRNKHIKPEIFDELKKHFTETEIVEIIWINAAEMYFKSLAMPFAITADGLLAVAQERDKSRMAKDQYRAIKNKMP
jgi:alkylhydroperoxidase family enzyme